MVIDHSRFREFLELSAYWSLRDQRYISAIGFELLVCDEAFTRLYAECQRLTDVASPGWAVDEAITSSLVVLARAIVDHAVRAQKLVKAYSSSADQYFEFSEGFFQQNQDLFALRDAVHHIDSRIDSNEAFEHLQPLNGDLSWIHRTGPHSFDVYWITFGTVAGGEWASPAFQSTMEFRHPIDHVRYRAHGIEVDLATAYLNLLKFLGDVHDLLRQRLETQLAEHGLPLDGEAHERLPRHISSRMRIGPAPNETGENVNVES